MHIASSKQTDLQISNPFSHISFKGKRLDISKEGVVFSFPRIEYSWKESDITTVDHFSHFDLRCAFHDSFSYTDIYVKVQLNLVQVFPSSKPFIQRVSVSVKNAYHMMLSSSDDQSAFFSSLLSHAHDSSREEKEK